MMCDNTSYGNSFNTFHHRVKTVVIAKRFRFNECTSDAVRPSKSAFGHSDVRKLNCLKVWD